MPSGHSLRRVFVSGGGSGIGLAVARSFASAGHDVTIAGRDQAKLAATGLPWIGMDVTAPESVYAAIRQAGPIDVFIANAGAATTAPALKTSHEDWDAMLAVNLSSVFYCAKVAIPPMIENGWGRFIAIASTASLKGYAYSGAYAAAKHGVLGWIRSLAIELAKTGVTANAICPGFTDTPMVAGSLERTAVRTGRSKADLLASLERSNPMGRLVNPDEVAAAARWIAGEDAASTNGQAITIDGGETIS